MPDSALTYFRLTHNMLSITNKQTLDLANELFFGSQSASSITGRSNTTFGSLSSSASSSVLITASGQSNLSALSGIGAGQVSNTGTPTAWSPSEIPGLSLWIDAADVSRTTATSGRLTSYSDKSPTNRAITGGTPSPQTNGEINGLPAFRLAPTEHIVLEAIPTTTQLSAFFMTKGEEPAQVLSTLLGNNGSLLIPIGASSSATNTEVFRGTVGPTLIRKNGSDTVWANRGAAHASLTGTSANILALVDITLTGNNLEFIGRGPFSYYFRGMIGEVIFTPHDISVSDIEKIEGYLAHKWGTQADLPMDHVYKSAPPGNAVVTVTANLDKSLNPLSSIGAGTVENPVPSTTFGILEKTLNELTAVSLASAQIQAIGVPTLSGITLSSSGQNETSSQLNKSLSSLISTGNITNLNLILGNRTLGNITSTGSVGTTVSGALSKQLGALTQQASSFSVLPILANLDKSLGSVSQAAATSVIIQGSSNRTLGDVTPSSAGSSSISGSLTRSLDSVVSQGLSSSSISGQSNKSLNPLSVAASLNVPNDIRVNIALGTLTSISQSVVITNANGNGQLGNLTLIGSTSASAIAVLNATLGSVSSAGQVSSGINGYTSKTLGSISTVANSNLPISLNTEKTLAVLTGTGFSSVSLNGSLSRSLGSLTSTSGTTVSNQANLDKSLGSLIGSGNIDSIAGIGLDKTLGSLSSIGYIEVVPVIQSNLTKSLNGVTSYGEINAVISINGSSNLDSISTNADANLPIEINSVSTLGGIGVSSNGSIDIHASGENTLDGLTSATAVSVIVRMAMESSLGDLTGFSQAANDIQILGNGQLLSIIQTANSQVKTPVVGRRSAIRIG